MKENKLFYWNKEKFTDVIFKGLDTGFTSNFRAQTVPKFLPLENFDQILFTLKGI